MKKSLLVVFMVMALLVAFAVTASADEAATTGSKTVKVEINRSEAEKGENGDGIFAVPEAKLMPGDRLEVTYKLGNASDLKGATLEGYTLELYSEDGRKLDTKTVAAGDREIVVVTNEIKKKQVSEWTWKISNGEDTLDGNIHVQVGATPDAPKLTVTTNNAKNYIQVGDTAVFYKAAKPGTPDKGGIKITAQEGYTVKLDEAALADKIEKWTGDTEVDKDVVAVIPFANLKPGEANEITVPVTWEYTGKEYAPVSGSATVALTIYKNGGDTTLTVGLPADFSDGSVSVNDEKQEPISPVKLTGTSAEYVLHVDAAAEPIEVTFTPATGAEVKIDGTSAASALTKELAPGDVVSVSVTAGSITSTYTIKVVGDYDAAVLKTVTLKYNTGEGTDAVEKKVVITGNTTTVTLPAQAKQITSAAFVCAGDASAKMNTPVNLKAGELNTIPIEVTALNGETETYYLAIMLGELPSATVSITSAPASHKGEAFEVKGTYTGEFVGLAVTNATFDVTSSANGRFTATVTPEAGTTAAIKVTATAKGDGVNLAAAEVTATKTVNYLTTAPNIDLYFGTSANNAAYLTDKTPENTTSSNRHDLDLSASVDNFYITWSVPTGYDKNLVELSISGTQIDDVRSGNGYYRVHLENDWYDSSYRTFTIQYKYAGSAVQTYYYTLHRVGNLYLAEVGYNDDDRTTSSSNYEEIRLTAGKTFYVEDIRDSAFDWDDTLYFYAEASRSAYDVEVRYHANSSVSWSKADKADRVSRTSDFWEIPYEEGDEVYVYVLVEDDGDELETYTFALNGEESTLELDDLEAATGPDSRDDDYTIVPGMTGGVYDYYILVPYSMDDEAVYVRADASRSYDVYVDGGSTDENGDWVKIASSASSAGSFKIEVVDGSDRGEYTVHVEVAPRDADDDDQLDDITIKSAARSSTKASSRHSVSLSPSFSSSRTSYTAYSSEEYIWVSVDGTRDQLIFVNGEKVSYNGTSAAIKLEKGRNEVEVITVAENCDDITTYEIDVMYQSSVLLESLSVGSSTMSPAFSATTRNYIAHVGANVSSISISARAQDDSAAIAIGSSAYGEGRASGSVSLQPGVNVVTVYVGSRTSGNYYTVSIYRETANPTVVVSNQKIAVDNGSAQTLTAYNIGGNNFLQLRDLAALLRNTDAAFSLSYNDSTRTATMTSGGTYRLTGLENAALAKYKSCVASNQSFVLDRASVYPMAYNIDGVNYVMIRDLACLMDFGVSYSDSARTLYVDTDGSYSPAY